MIDFRNNLDIPIAKSFSPRDLAKVIRQPPQVFGPDGDREVRYIPDWAQVDIAVTWQHDLSGVRRDLQSRGDPFWCEQCGDGNW